MSKYDAIGIIEVRYFTNAVRITDIMVKESELEILGVEKYLGGKLISIIIGGSIDNVKNTLDILDYRFDESQIKNKVMITNPQEEIMKFILKEPKVVKKINKKLKVESKKMKIENKKESK